MVFVFYCIFSIMHVRTGVCMHLQVFGSLLVAGHEHELSANAAEVHVTQKGGTLHCGVICGLWKQNISCSITVHSGKEITTRKE